LSQLSPRQFFSSDGRPTFASDIFDTGACIVSSFIGGGNPKCRGQGNGSGSSGSGDNGGKGGNGSNGSGNGGSNGNGAAIPDKDKESGSGGTKSQDTGYSYDFKNNPDGSATYTVKPNRNGKSCEIKLEKDERDNLNAVLGKLAKECS
jgi:hypothetical protein